MPGLPWTARDWSAIAISHRCQTRVAGLSLIHPPHRAETRDVEELPYKSSVLALLPPHSESFVQDEDGARLAAQQRTT